MSTIVTRSGKGSPLSHVEVDANFTNLNSDKIQSGNTVAALTITSATINGGAITGITDLAIADGGTGASDAATARTNLGLAIGTNVQAYDADLTAIAALAPTADNFIVGNGTAWTLETPAQTRTSLGLGTAALVADSTLVHTSGNETIGGTKTFSVDASISGLTVGKGAGSATNATAFGNGAMAGTSNYGSDNTAVGYQTLNVNVGGAKNTAIGSGALKANTTDLNTALGYNSLTANTTGTNNVALGVQSLQANTTASNNTAVGFQAGYSTTVGTLNTAIGYQSLYSATNNSAYNTAIGGYAGYSQSGSSYNTYVGRYAGYLHTGELSLFVGEYAGYNTTGSSNNFLGRAAGYLVTTGAKNTIVGSYYGNQGGLDIRTASNYIVLSDGDGNPRGIFDGSGNFIVGTAAIVSTEKSYIYQSGTGRVLIARNVNASFADDCIQASVDRNTTNGTFNAFAYYNAGAGAYKFKVLDSGTVQNTTGTYTTISDAKLKENIVDATPQLDKLTKTRVVNYNLIGDDLKQIGWIAQELEEVYPNLVFETPDRDKDGVDLGTTTKGVKLTVMIPILVKAIQELNAKVDAQALEIAALKGN
jgi:uncharacterized protein YbcV (DUF1398 family)